MEVVPFCHEHTARRRGSKKVFVFGKRLAGLEFDRKISVCDDDVDGVDVVDDDDDDDDDNWKFEFADSTISKL